MAENRDSTREFCTPPELAKRLGIATEKVLGWIKTEDLKAVNVATNLAGRPRWRIAASAVEDFFQARQNLATLPKPERRRMPRSGVINFY